MPFIVFPSAMQFRNSRWPLELVVPPPVHLLPKPLAAFRETIPSNRTYVPLTETPPTSMIGSSQG
jgi:hypothetical protein